MPQSAVEPSEFSIHIVLVEPEIPQNTGNIARSCAATGASLHLVGRLGFSLEDRYLRRAGLDYWSLLDLHRYDDLPAYLDRHPHRRCVFATISAQRSHTDLRYGNRCSIVLGKETSGLPTDLLKANREHCIRIPMRVDARSLNLSNAAAIILYEVLRQHGYPDLSVRGRPRQDD